MSVELFSDDDRGYAAWLTANAAGYVLNIQRSMNPSDARVHEAACRTWPASLTELDRGPCRTPTRPSLGAASASTYPKWPRPSLRDTRDPRLFA
jgi:hypothetical protein